MKLTGTGVLAVAALAALAVVGLVLWRKFPDVKRAAEQLVTRQLNPASSENLLYQADSAVVSSAVGYEETVGGALADWWFKVTHGGQDVVSVVTSDQVKPVQYPGTVAP